MIRMTSLFATLLLVASSENALGQVDPPGKRLSLNDRVFLNTRDVYDPSYGLRRIGVVKDNVLDWLPLEEDIRKYPPPKIIPRNFKVYTARSEEGGSGSISIPVIGLVGEVSAEKVAYADLEDISEVEAPSRNFTTCDIWKLIPHDQVSPGDRIILTDHAVLSKLQYGMADKQAAGAQAGIGGYFGIGGNLYKTASNDTKVPLISVTGVSFVVPDPKTFCKGRLLSAPIPAKFSNLMDISRENLRIKGENSQ